MRRRSQRRIRERPRHADHHLNYSLKSQGVMRNLKFTHFFN